MPALLYNNISCELLVYIEVFIHKCSRCIHILLAILQTYILCFENKEWALLTISPTSVLSPAPEANGRQCRYYSHHLPSHSLQNSVVQAAVPTEFQNFTEMFFPKLLFLDGSWWKIYIKPNLHPKISDNKFSFGFVEILVPSLCKLNELFFLSQTVEIKVKMDCDGCERRVKNAVKTMKGRLLLCVCKIVCHALDKFCVLRGRRKKVRQMNIPEIIHHAEPADSSVPVYLMIS